MPKKGFKAVTVPQEVYDSLKERAKENGISLPQLIEQYMRHAHSLNDLLWLKECGSVQSRIQQIASAVYSVVVRARHKERAKKFRVKGESVPSLSYEENEQLMKEAREVAEEVANMVIEKDKESYKEWKRREQETRLKTWLSMSSDQVKSAETDLITKRLVSVTYKKNKEVIHDKLEKILSRLGDLFGEKASLTELRANLDEVSKINLEWKDLQKYMPYLPKKTQKLDQKIAKILGV